MRPMQKGPGVFYFTPGLFYIRLMYYANVSNGSSGDCALVKNITNLNSRY